MDNWHYLVWSSLFQLHVHWILQVGNFTSLVAGSQELRIWVIFHFWTKNKHCEQLIRRCNMFDLLHGACLWSRSVVQMKSLYGNWTWQLGCDHDSCACVAAWWGRSDSSRQVGSSNAPMLTQPAGEMPTANAPHDLFLQTANFSA